jgi:hypothetical protein
VFYYYLLKRLHSSSLSNEHVTKINKIATAYGLIHVIVLLPNGIAKGISAVPWRANKSCRLSLHTDMRVILIVACSPIECLLFCRRGTVLQKLRRYCTQVDEYGRWSSRTERDARPACMVARTVLHWAWPGVLQRWKISCHYRDLNQDRPVRSPGIISCRN